MIAVATWNLLHRVHAENWDEPVTQRWPDEAERIAAITARLAARTEQVIALQEVSGDQLTSLRAALPGRTIHSFQYPRVPTPRKGRDLLHDRTEHLVLLINGVASTQVAAESFPDDKGKGALAVDVAGTLAIATHVSGDRRRAGQLARLAALAGPATVLLGDFNTVGGTITSGLGDGFAVAGFQAGSLPTRPGSSRGFIDHVVVRGATATTAEVDDGEGLSDHNIVHSMISPLPRDETLLELLREQDGHRTEVMLQDGRTLTVFNIAWGYDIGDEFAHVTTNISPAVDGTPVDVFSTEHVVAIVADGVTMFPSAG